MRNLVRPFLVRVIVPLLAFLLLLPVVFAQTTTPQQTSAATATVAATGKPAGSPSTPSVKPSSKPSLAPTKTPAPTPTPFPTSTADKPVVPFNIACQALFGDWSVKGDMATRTWKPGQAFTVSVDFYTDDDLVQAAAKANVPVDRIACLVTAERTFDADGVLRLASDELLSTLLTPTGLAIEGGVQGAITDRFGYKFRTPVDQLDRQPLVKLPADNPQNPGAQRARFAFNVKLPDDLPPGLYRLRFDFGIQSGKRLVSLCGSGFSYRTTTPNTDGSSAVCTPFIRASGTHVSGRQIDAKTIKPRLPWVLLSAYNSNGYKGVVADEDKPNFALSDRNIIPDEVILPFVDVNGKKQSYNLEPAFPTDTVDPSNAIRWNWVGGQIAATITGPDGKTVALPKLAFVGKGRSGPTTKHSEYTNWVPPSYGHYQVKLSGWLEDIWGNRIDGGGTYGFWIANRMTMATATFQGQPYPVGTKYGRDTVFFPSVPAKVHVDCALYPQSDPEKAKTLTYDGYASPAGLFGMSQGMKPFPLDEPGEYRAKITATWTDPAGTLWVCAMTHAGVVYAPDSAIVAHGKKIRVGKDWAERGESGVEGWRDTQTGEYHLEHIAFPYNSGDVLEIASESTGANKIEPVLTWDYKDQAAATLAPIAVAKGGHLFGQGNTAGVTDAEINGVGRSNCRFRTSNGYSPHEYPEYITDREYYYGAGPRPGFMSRFVVGEDGFRAPYWPTSSTNFGGQIGASSNGDLPGDVYRLLGGVVVRHKGLPAQYAGYMANAFILAKGSNNNRVVAAGSEDLNGADGTKARFFLVGLRPGTTYVVGSVIGTAIQIDPILPVHIKYTLYWPDGRTRTTEGDGDATGYFTGADRYTLDIPGMYRYTLEASWQGHSGGMPGLGKEGGQMYVLDAISSASVPQGSPANTAKPEGLAPPVQASAQSGLAPTDGGSSQKPVAASDVQTIGKPQKTFHIETTARVVDPETGIVIRGTSAASKVWYTILMPGAVLDQGEIAVKDGRFHYYIDPQALSAKFPIYDIKNILSGKPDIGRVIHATFFSAEPDGNGGLSYQFSRIILRGKTVVAVP